VRVIAVDGAQRMLDHARADLLAVSGFACAEFQVYIPGTIFRSARRRRHCNSLLHHFDDRPSSGSVEYTVGQPDFVWGDLRCRPPARGCGWW
jgi:hypothetical protein